jgi:hypothetical protein
MRQSGSDHQYEVRGRAGSTVTTVDIAIHATDLATLISIDGALRTELQGFHGAIGSMSVQFVKLVSVQDDAWFAEEEGLWVLSRLATYELKHAE